MTTLTTHDSLTETIGNIALQIELDRGAAIRAAIRQGAAVEDEARPGFRYWFATALPAHLRPARIDYGQPWVDEDGRTYATSELPYTLVEATNQSEPGEYDDEDEGYEEDEDAIEGIR